MHQKNFLFVASELKFLISPATFPYDYCYSSISLMSGYDKLHWARKTDSASADILTFICWLEVAGCVLAAPFTMGASLLLLFTVVPLNFLLIRMVNEQIKQTRLLMLVVYPEYSSPKKQSGNRTVDKSAFNLPRDKYLP